MRTNGQERAEFVLSKISGIKIDKKFKSFTAGAPTVILQNGFGQAMAFWLSKGEEKHKFVFESVKDWLIKKGIVVSNSEDVEFVKKLSTIEQSEYLAAQKEALMLLEWIKRYTAAFCEE
jgi:CRISPR-associated protein Cmr5